MSSIFKQTQQSKLAGRARGTPPAVVKIVAPVVLRKNAEIETYARLFLGSLSASTKALHLGRPARAGQQRGG